MKTFCQLTVLLMAGTLSFSAMAADSPKDKQARRMQLLLNAAQQEKTDLAAQVDALKNKVSELESKRAALEKKLSGQSKQLTDLADKQQQTDLKDRQQQEELSNKYQDSEKRLKLMEEQYTTISKNLQQTQLDKEREKMRFDSDIKVCEKKNTELYLFNVKLMSRYQSKGMMEVMRQAEPFTQLEQVKLENLLQEYRDKLEANKISTNKTLVSDGQHP